MIDGDPGVVEVSVIIPAYRAAATVGRALASVARQTLRPREAVVVDDGSDDGTIEAARAAAEKMEGIAVKIFAQDHMGAGAARNRAIAEASCGYVAFLDADDEWLPDKLARSMPHFTDDRVVLVSHNVLVNDGGDEVVVDCASLVPEGDRFTALYRRGYISTSTAIARRDAVLAAGGFDSGLANAQDFDLWLSMARPPENRFVVFDAALTRYHVGRDSIMSNTERRLACCLIIARRHACHLTSRWGPFLASLWFRVAAVHYEAAAAHRARGRLAMAAWTCARLPVKLAVLTVATLCDRARVR